MQPAWTILKVIQWTAGYLREKGVEGARRDAEVLLGAVLKLDRVGLYLNFDRPLEAAELAGYREMIGRRARREPVAYILGQSEFWSLPLRVGPAVLIPRPDSEVLVEEALGKLVAGSRVLDVGTGSGAIVIALAHEFADACYHAIDLSSAAIDLARENARRNGVEERIHFEQGDLHRLPRGPFDLIVSNPPYIAQGELAELQPEIRDHEPQLALAGGTDGLDCYRSMAAQAGHCLAERGWLMLEVGIGQADGVRQLLATEGLEEIFCREDYAGVSRVVAGRRATG